MDDKDVLSKHKNTLFEIPMPISNQEKLIEFLRHLKNNTHAVRTQINSIDTFILFCREIKTEFTELSKIDIYRFLDYLDEYTYVNKAGIKKNYAEASKQRHRRLFKSFLKYLKRNDLADLISLRRSQNSKLPEDLLTKEEIEQLINKAEYTRDKALIAVLYESGARRGELLACNLNHVAFDDDGCVLTFPSGKTGARRIRLVYSASYLRIWVESHPLKDDKDREAPLWCLVQHPHTRCSTSAFTAIVKAVAKKAGISKKVNPHNFRHSRATHLAALLTEQQMKNYLGWTKDSAMASIYVHLSGKDMDDAILKMHGIVKGDIRTDSLRVGVCPRCKHINPEIENYCGKCGLPLTQTEAKKLEKDKSEIDLELMRATILSPDILAEIEKRLRR
jgi:integrase/recombinase XerD